MRRIEALHPARSLVAIGHSHHALGDGVSRELDHILVALMPGLQPFAPLLFFDLIFRTPSGRPPMIQHEFTSKVKGQVCARDVEAELAEPFELVSRSLQARMVFGPAVADVTVAQPR